MKKFAKIALVAVCAALIAAFVFAGCKENKEGEPLAGAKMTFVLDDKAGTVETVEADLSAFDTGDSAMDVIKQLAADKKLCYKESDGMLTEAGVWRDGKETYIVSQNAAEGVYLYLYTNVDADKNDYEGMTTVEYGGEVLAESLNGIGQMHIEDGAVIYITTIVWAM